MLSTAVLTCCLAHAGTVTDPITEHDLYSTGFSGPDGTSPAGWVAAQGAWALDSGRYVQSSASGPARSWYDVGPQSTMSIQALVHLISGSVVRLHWSAADVGQHYVEWDATADRLRIVEGGALRREIEFFFYPDQPFEFRVEIQSGWLYVYVNHHHWLDVSISTLPDGKVGLGTNNASASFDDFLVMDALFYDERPIMRLPYAAGESLAVRTLYDSGHRGVDFGWINQDEYHVPMSAVAAGTVTYAAIVSGQSLITIHHGNGFESRYAHAEPIYVSPGQQVKQGDVIGRMARWGTSWDHVHLEIYRRGEVLKPLLLSGYRDFCLFNVCGAWYSSDNVTAPAERVGIVEPPGWTGDQGQTSWRDDFTGWVIDQKKPLPAWSGLGIHQHPVPGDEGPWNRSMGKLVSYTAIEQDGWLRMPRSARLRTREYYTALEISAKVRFDDPSPADGCPRSNLELRFRESDYGGSYSQTDGVGYALVLDAFNDLIELRQANSFERIQGLVANRPIGGGEVYYLSVACDDALVENIHVRVGTFEGGGDIVDWRINDRQHAAGCVRISNQCATQIAWDWIEVSGSFYDPDAPPPPTLPGDFDQDGDVDQTDVGRFQACFSGPGVPQDDPACVPAKFDIDEDVDQDDLTSFLSCLSGANVPADPRCAD